MKKTRRILRAISNGLFPFYPFRNMNRWTDIRLRVTSFLLLWGMIFFFAFKYVAFEELVDLIKYLFE